MRHLKNILLNFDGIVLTLLLLRTGVVGLPFAKGGSGFVET